MESLRGAGSTVGECVGNGQGESVSVGSEGGTLDAGPEVEHPELEEDGMMMKMKLGLKIVLFWFYMTAKQQGSVFTVTTLLTLVPKSLLLKLHSCTAHWLPRSAMQHAPLTFPV